MKRAEESTVITAVADAMGDDAHVRFAFVKAWSRLRALESSGQLTVGAKRRIVQEELYPVLRDRFGGPEDPQARAIFRYFGVFPVFEGGADNANDLATPPPTKGAA